MVSIKMPSTNCPVAVASGAKDSKNETKRAFIPVRYILTFLTFTGMTLIFAQRVCLNVAMVAMVNSTAHDTEENISNLTGELDDRTESKKCPDTWQNSLNVTLKSRQGSYDWTPYTQGVILGSYFYGYVFAQIIGGKLADFFGAKRMFGLATLASSLFSLATPPVAGVNNSSSYLIALRVVLGLIHGMNYPSAYTLFSKWAPVQERGTMLSICVIGTHFGVVLSMMLTGYLCEFGFAGGWPSSFYVLGFAGVIWSVFWWLLVFDSPNDHPRISDRELGYILKNLPNTSGNRDLPTPWLKAVRCLPLWAATVAKFTGAWSFICFQTKLPVYLDEILHLPIEKNGMVNALLFGVLCLSIVSCGIASDILRSRKYCSITTLRKSFELVALLGPAACMVSIPAVGCNTTAVVALLTAAMGLFGFCGGGDVSVIVDIVPDFSGKIFGVSNAIASIPGILSPIVSGIFLDGTKGDVRRWAYIFYVSVAMYLFGAIIFLVFGSAETQSWGVAGSSDDDDSKSNDDPEKGSRKIATLGVSNKFHIFSPISSVANKTCWSSTVSLTKYQCRTERSLTVVSAGEMAIF